MRKLAWLGVLLLVGCANTAPMAVTKQTKSIDTSKASVVLMTVDVGRKEESRFIPQPTYVGFVKKDGAPKPERISFRIDDDAGEAESRLHNKFLLRVALAPGNYQLAYIAGTASAFPIPGSFLLPLLMDIDVAPNSVTYVGRVTATMRPRVGEEFRAGPVIPLIDQAVAGISGSTFDVAVTDASQEDIAAFKAAFPALAGANIRQQMLPAFNRPRVQAWWDNDGTEPAASANDGKQAQAGDAGMKQAQK